MKIALFGANGQVGKRIAAEALDRGHDVLAVVRNPAVARTDDRALVTAGDATYARTVTNAVSGVDAVVSAVGPRKAAPFVMVRVAQGLLDGLSAAGVNRLVVVGCGEPGGEVAAGSEPEAEGPTLAEAHQAALAALRDGGGDLSWTWVCPTGPCQAGARSGRYVTSAGPGEAPAGLRGDPGEPLSLEDLAAAVVDELEQARFSGDQMSVSAG